MSGTSPWEKYKNFNPNEPDGVKSHVRADERQQSLVSTAKDALPFRIQPGTQNAENIRT
jgi:hypothetical protein